MEKKLISSTSHLQAQRQPPQVLAVPHVRLVPGARDEHHVDLPVAHQVRSVRPPFLDLEHVGALDAAGAEGRGGTARRDHLVPDLDELLGRRDDRVLVLVGHGDEDRGAGRGQAGPCGDGGLGVGLAEVDVDAHDLESLFFLFFPKVFFDEVEKKFSLSLALSLFSLLSSHSALLFYLSGRLHLRAQQRVRPGKLLKGKHGLLDRHVSQHGLFLEADFFKGHARHQQRGVGGERVAHGFRDERHGARGAGVGLDDVDVLVLDAVLDVEQACCF